MSNIQSITIQNGDDEVLIAVIPGVPIQKTTAARSGHAKFDEIVAALAQGATADTLVRLFDASEEVAQRFENISDRVQVGNGRVLFDGAPVDNSLTKQIMRFVEEDQDFTALVNFMEKVMDNPQEHSRTQLYDWLDRHAFTITSNGDIVAYKGVAGSGGDYRSISRGVETVYVDGEPHVGAIPNPVGATVNMDRSLVEHDPSVGCHVGLHVGTYDYASSFSRGTVLEVHVNPRDIVSVPTDCNWAKVRCCRYSIVDAIDQPYSTGLIDVDGVEDDYDYDWIDEDMELDEPKADDSIKVGDTVNLPSWAHNTYGTTGEVLYVSDDSNTVFTRVERGGFDAHNEEGNIFPNSAAFSLTAVAILGEDEAQTDDGWDF